MLFKRGNFLRLIFPGDIPEIVACQEPKDNSQERRKEPFFPVFIVTERRNISGKQR